MKLYLMRHGPAENQADSGVDAERALTSAGRDRVSAVAKLLVQGGEAPVRIVTSPLVRAVQTAEIVAMTTTGATAGGATLRVRGELSPGGAPEDYVRHVMADGWKRVLLVGHEPDLSGLSFALIGALGRPFDKAMVVGIHLRPEGARLRFVLDPQSLRIESAAVA